MKTTTIIATIIMILQVNLLFASSDGVPVNTFKQMNNESVLIMAPATPAEATFEDMSPDINVFNLTPVTPKEATFEEESEGSVDLSLAPTTPVEADFSAEETDTAATLDSVAPVTPAQADFTELP
jgi:hypothetical protein